jgi:hypothetical protein
MSAEAQLTNGQGDAPQLRVKLGPCLRMQTGPPRQARAPETVSPA